MNKELDIYISNRYEQIKKAAKNVNCPLNYDIEDILHENLLYLYEMPEEKIKAMIEKDTLHLYISRCIKLSATSQSSKYQSKNNFLKYHMLSDSFDKNLVEENKLEVYEHYDELYKLIMNFLNTLHWYDRTLYMQYMKGDAAIDITRKTNIPISSVSLTIKTVKDKIKQFINQNNLKLNVAE